MEGCADPCFTKKDSGEHKANPDYVQGAKGVDGGAAVLLGSYQN